MAGEMDGRKRTQKTHMPGIVIVIDEVVDLLNSSPMAEDLLLRILEGGAEVGIHLIMSAQCPTSHSLSVLLSRVPSRICMRVLSEEASQTLIGVSGGERLLGEGDMLFVPHGALAPLHIRGAYLSDSEIMAVIDCISKENGGKISAIQPIIPIMGKIGSINANGWRIKEE